MHCSSLLQHALRTTVVRATVLVLATSNALAGPPNGACCIPNRGVTFDCIELNQAECAKVGGTFQGEGVPCDPDPCNPPLGACCVPLPDGNVACIEVTQAHCALKMGAYQGDDTTCSATKCPVPIGACCIAPDPGCVAPVTAAYCASIGGTWGGNDSSCGSARCPPACYIELGTGNTNGLVEPDCSPDDDWLLFSSPLNMTFVPARTTAPELPTWVTAPHAAWLGESVPATCTLDEPPGVYLYRFNFNLDFTTQRDFLLTLEVAADDSATVELNSNPIGSVSGPTTLTTISIGTQSLFDDGTNTIAIYVTNIGTSSVGLLVQGNVRFRQMIKDLSTGTALAFPEYQPSAPLSHGDVEPDWWRCADDATPFVNCGDEFDHEPHWCTDPLDGSWVSDPEARWIESNDNAPAAGDGCTNIAEICEFWNDFTLDDSTHTNFKLDLFAAASENGSFHLDGWATTALWNLTGPGTLAHIQTSAPTEMTPGHHFVLAFNRIQNAAPPNVLGFFAVGGVFAECVLEDCNQNGYADIFDVANGFSEDCNDNGVPDECDPPCPADIVPPGGDCYVTIADVVAVITAFGLPCGDCPEDIAPPPDGDGEVTIADITLVTSSIGPCP